MGVTSLRAEVSGNTVVPDEVHGHTAVSAPAVPDKVEILALVERALSWDLDNSALPPVEDALELAKWFTAYGRIVAADLDVLLSDIPTDSHVGGGAQATLSEAGRRLTLKPLAPTAAPRSAARRTQNLARLIQALNRAVGRIGEEQVRSRPGGPPQRR
ncbi:hypothetical protein ACFQ0X_22155 [Streptomyces rectiviolaceus]|uniref:Uncharacterized protein n=1 Tax=Streptomyces rectiviolaceus TaxID=332591 RepID=A0ABP6M9U1_9ACTN